MQTRGCWLTRRREARAWRVLPLDLETESVVQSQGAGPSDGLWEPKEEERHNMKATTTVASKMREVHMAPAFGELNTENI